LGDERSGGRLPPGADVAALDRLVARLVDAASLRFAVATTDAERDAAYRLRHDAVVAGGWAQPTEDGREHDSFDSAAVHVLGWDGLTAVCAGRLVPPPGPLPTEEACGISVAPAGQVVDVGRMVVAPSHRGRDHRVFVLLLGHLYLEVRRLGFSVGCGMMTAPVRALARQLGFSVEVLGPERVHWHEMRTPVRFVADQQAASLLTRWAGQ
jgi:GNAT superfamily N-acetyltransferase